MHLNLVKHKYKKGVSYILKIGRVTHYYDKIGMGVVELNGGLTVGDTVVFVKEGKDLFQQKIDSIQIEHKKVDYAPSGTIVGLKLLQPVLEDCEVYKI